MNLSEFVFPVRVYIEDTDYGGIVFHANYLNYFERARSEMADQAGFGLSFQQQEGVSFLVRQILIDYLKPGRLWDELEVVSHVKQVKQASFIYTQQLRFTSAPDTILCKADVKLVCVNKGLQPCSLPERFSRWVQSGLT